MNHKTKTTLAHLRTGDRFVKGHNEKKIQAATVWQLLSIGKKYATINVVTDAGHKMYDRDQLENISAKIIFIRHTIPLPGEETLLQNLSIGDVFKKTAGDVHEYILEKTGHQFYEVRRTDLAAHEMGGKLATVIFVRKKD
jgi:hypothetical protein